MTPSSQSESTLRDRVKEIMFKFSTDQAYGGSPESDEAIQEMLDLIEAEKEAHGEAIVAETRRALAALRGLPW